MSSHTHTHTDYFCDLCGAKMPGGRGITTLYMRNPRTSRSICDHVGRDVCDDCLSRPVSELTGAFRRHFRV